MTAARHRIDVTPGGLALPDAARFVGLGETSFLDAVKSGQIPRARRHHGIRRLVWLTRELQGYLDDLPVDGEPADKPQEPVDL